MEAGEPDLSFSTEHLFPPAFRRWNCWTSGLWIQQSPFSSVSVLNVENTPSFSPAQPTVKTTVKLLFLKLSLFFSLSASQINQ